MLLLLCPNRDQLRYLISLQSYGEYQISVAIVTTNVTHGLPRLGQTWICSDRAWFLSDVSYNVYAREKQNKIEIYLLVTSQ
jgi:hypothetical protein